MPPPSLINTSLFICERTLSEKDGVPSFIRNVDLFFVAEVPEVPPEKRPLIMTVVAILKFISGDVSDYAAQINLIRPNGENTALVHAPKVSLKTRKYPELPGGFNVIQQVAIAPTQLGTHYLALLLNGEEVARTPFTLAPPPKPEVLQ